MPKSEEFEFSKKIVLDFISKFKVLQGLIDEEVPMSTLRARARDLKPGSKKKNCTALPPVGRCTGGKEMSGFWSEFVSGP